MTNVSTKYLNAYIGFFSYVHNYKVDNGNASFTTKDAENVLIEILKNGSKYTVSDLKATVLTLPKPSPRYMALLKAETEKARKITQNAYFKFDEEDKVISFDKRKYLSDLPETRLKEVCKDYKIKYQRKWVRWANISQILKHPDINKIIIGLIQKDKAMQITNEDLDYLSKEQYRNHDNPAS